MLFLNDIFIKLLNMSITASYVIIIILAVRFLIRKFPKKYSYYLWSVVGLRLIFPFSITSAFSFLNFNMFTNVNTGIGGAEYIPSDIGFADMPVIDVGVNSVNETINNILPQAEAYNSVNPMQIVIFGISFLWVTGMFIILGYEIFLFFKTKNLIKKAVFYKDNIYECDNIPSPFVRGIIKPKIYIPFRLGEKEFSYIICHEKYHIKRYDNIIKAISSFILIVYWFNPFIWAGYFYMNMDMEMSCDEKVISEMGNCVIKDYGNTLLSFALNRRYLPLGPLSFGESFAGKRIKNILKFKNPKLWISFLGVFIVIIIDAVCLTNGNSADEEDDFAVETENNDILTNTLSLSGGTNFIIAGVDETSYFTDTIIVGRISDKNELNLISIPRDTYISFTDEQERLLKEVNSNPPKLTKISRINIYGKEKYGMKILKEQAEKILGINIDYYFKIDLKGLRNIVDSIGGVYFNVPENGLKYSDPSQNLYIDIKGGYQLLDGVSSEGLLRFRSGYRRQDLDRIDVSREFIKEFISQVFSRDNIKDNLNSIADSCIKYVKTDFPAVNIPIYIESFKNIETINGETLKGSYQYIDNGIYYIYDDSDAQKTAEKFFEK